MADSQLLEFVERIEDVATRTDEWPVAIRRQALVDLERLAYGDADVAGFAPILCGNFGDGLLAVANVVGCGPGRVPAVAEFNGAADASLTIASHPDRWMRFLYRTRLEMEPIDEWFHPESLDRAQILISDSAPILEIHAERFKFLLRPARGAPEDQPATGENIDCGQLFGGDFRVAIRKDNGGSADPHPACDRPQ